VIRRAFWLGAGATAGILGYRRVCAVGRKVSGKVAGAAPVTGRTARGALGMAREAIGFTRDVREGMEVYIARHNAPAASTLETRRAAHGPDQKDGR